MEPITYEEARELLTELAEALENDSPEAQAIAERCVETRALREADVMDEPLEAHISDIAAGAEAAGPGIALDLNYYATRGFPKHWLEGRKEFGHGFAWGFTHGHVPGDEDSHQMYLVGANAGVHFADRHERDYYTTADIDMAFNRIHA